MLEVVEDEERLAVAQLVELVNTDRRSDRRGHELRPLHARKRHEEDAARKVVDDLGRGLQREPGLPGPARSGDGDETRGAGEESDDLPQLALPADERVRRDRQVRRVQRLQRREVAVAELPDPFRRRQVLQPVLAEVAKRTGADELAGRLRHQHLPAVPHRRDPRRPMHIDPDVAAVGHQRLTRVHAHPHPDGAVQSLLTLRRSGKRIRRPRKRDEERIPLRVHLDAAMPRERASQHPPMLRQRIRVCVAQLVQQPRRALDVREQERDRPTR